MLELSSFQTSDLDASPPVGVLLNLFREHTDWHGSQERYHADKLNLFAHRPGMTSVLNGADPAVRVAGARLPNPAWFRDPAGFDAGPGGVTRAGAPYLARADIPLAGEHNLDNVCAALAALEAAGVRLEDPAAAVAGFRPLAHRLEPVGERDGVLWVNDSIATIPEATVAAARALAPRPTVILVGGRDRTQDYGPLAAYLASGEASVAGLVAMPANGPDVARPGGRRRRTCRWRPPPRWRRRWPARGRWSRRAAPCCCRRARRAATTSPTSPPAATRSGAWPGDPARPDAGRGEDRPGEVIGDVAAPDPHPPQHGAPRRPRAHRPGGPRTS